MTNNTKNQISRKSFLVFTLLISFLFSSQAQSDTIYLATNENLQQLLTIIEKDQKTTKIWWNSWLGIYSAATIVQAGIALQTKKTALKQDMYLGAATTLLGAGAQLFTPMVKINKTFFEENENLSPQERLKKMNEAYELLQQSNVFEKAGRSWQNHAKCTVVNLGSGLITWLAFDRTIKDGILNFIINTAITEAQIFTQPVIAKNAFQKYSKNFITGEYIPIYKPQATFSACATGAGFQLKIVF